MESDLLLGPVLRRVESGKATIWTETARPATVEVRAGEAGGSARTFSAHGHHYGIVVVDGLPDGAVTPYEVLIDGRKVWPPADDRYPPPVIRTRAPGAGPVRIVFCSCRESSPLHTTQFPPDALDAYATRLSAAGRHRDDWPDVLMLLGDQVYADETSKAMKKYLRQRRAERKPGAPETQVVDFHEYTQLYVDSWTDPDIRWLLSTIPSVMIFDDHEIIDDWNISRSWRDDIAKESWWRERISAGLSSYWVYQHAGNLPPDELHKDPVFAAVTSAGDDATAVLDEFGNRADRAADTHREPYRWSYRFDLGRTRFVVIDNRAGRQLEPGARSMLSPDDWAWFAEQVTGDYDHLVVGSSLPWLMPPAIHHVEAASERLCEHPNAFVAAQAEKLRRGVDLEHWASFGASYDALTDLLRGVADRPDGPATTCVLSGDVHHSYVAVANLATRNAVYQLTCSPVHNKLPAVMKVAMRFSWSRVAERIGRGISSAAGLRAGKPLGRRVAGPVYDNAVSILVHDGRAAEVRIEHTKPDKQLHEAARVALS